MPATVVIMRDKRLLFTIVSFVTVYLITGFIAGLAPFASANLIIVADGFESGNFDAWTDTYGYPELVSDVKRTGSYGGFVNASGISGYILIIIIFDNSEPTNLYSILTLSEIDPCSIHRIGGQCKL